MNRSPERARRVDLVVAVRDEELTLEHFVRAARELVLPPDVELGFVFVEDSSKDGTRRVLERLAGEYPEVAYYCLARGFGQGPAIVFGLRKSHADAMIMLDGDGSHPLGIIPEMIRRYTDGAEIVQCRRRELTGRRRHRRFGAQLFYVFVRALTGRDPHEQNIYFRLVSTAVAARILAAPRTWHYLRFPLESFSGGRVAIVDIDMQERLLGKSKYGFLRLIDLAFIGIVTQISPARLAGISTVSVGASAALLAAGAGLLALPPALLATAAVVRYTTLGNRHLLQRLKVTGSSEGTLHAASSREPATSR